MKRYLLNALKGSAIAIAAAFTTTSQTATAQMVGGDIFLKGMYVEVGQCSIGAFGTCGNAPTGYHARAGGGSIKLGFVSDPGLDGWAVGVPTMMGDYFIPGSPHEGWSIMSNGSLRTAWGQCGGFGGGGAALTGSNTSYEVVGRTKIATWTGSRGDLAITARTILDTIRSFFVVEVELENTGTSNINNIYYERTVDPDNEQAMPEGAGSFVTTNSIVYQPTTADMKCLVTAIGTIYPASSYLGLGAKDCRATCYVLSSGLSPSSPPSSIVNGTYGNTGVDYTSSGDVGIGIIFDVGDLAPGEMTSLAYAYILKESDLDTAFQLLGSAWNIDGLPFNATDTYVVCRGKEIEVNINGGGAYEWGEWTPNIGLANPSGRNNVITVQDETITYRVIGITSVCEQSDTLMITIIPVGDTFPTSATICAGSVYDFNGQIVFTTGVYYQTHSTAVEGCDSVVKLTLSANPRPGVDITVDNSSLCEGGVATFQVLNPTSGTNYQWIRNGTPIAGATDKFYVASSLPGEYRVIGVTDKGCVDTSRRITLTINPAATVDILDLDIVKVCIGDTIDLSVDAKPGYEYYWEPEKSFRYTSGARLPKVRGIMFEEFNAITVRAINEYGCIAYDEMIVKAVPCCDVYLPTAFTPNGDGVNDYFTMMLREGQKIVTFQIFDRYGKMVYDNGSKMGWSGRDLDGNDVAQGAVYFFRIVYSCSDKQNYEVKGDVTLIR